RDVRPHHLSHARPTGGLRDPRWRNGGGRRPLGDHAHGLPPSRSRLPSDRGDRKRPRHPTAYASPFSLAARPVTVRRPQPGRRRTPLRPTVPLVALFDPARHRSADARSSVLDRVINEGFAQLPRSTTKVAANEHSPLTWSELDRRAVDTA